MEIGIRNRNEIPIPYNVMPCQTIPNKTTAGPSLAGSGKAKSSQNDRTHASLSPEDQGKLGGIARKSREKV